MMARLWHGVELLAARRDASSEVHVWLRRPGRI